jgi:hypothetical protein
MAKMTHRLAIFCLMGMVSGITNAQEKDDWRIDFLSSQKLSTDTDSLKKLLTSYHFSPENFAQSLKQLHSEQVAIRKQAQSAITLMGVGVIPEIKRIYDQEAPEAQLRLGQIIDALENKSFTNKDMLIQTAVSGLLYERENPGKQHFSRKIYCQWFDQSVQDLSSGYGKLRFFGADPSESEVLNGVLRLAHKGNQDEQDQRLLLHAKDLTDKKEWPQSFQLEVKVGGGADGSGTYHVGVSIGNIRALYHPGYRGGAFRLQQVSDEKVIIPNQEMGFDPSTTKLQIMKIKVSHMNTDTVELNISIIDGENSYRTAHVLKKSEIGKIETIGLDRSGRAGGDALFDDLFFDYSEGK